MGVGFSPVLYVGKKFEGEYNAKNFYSKFYDFTEEDEEVINNEGFQEWCSELENGLDGEILNCYSGGNFVFGFDVGSSVRQPETFSSAVEDAISKWKVLFGDEPFEIVHTVSFW